jgi:hypothetical protein
VTTPALAFRTRAIEELGLSSTIRAARTLGEITNDPAKSKTERQLAASTSVQVAARQVADNTSASTTTLLLASTGSTQLAVDAGPFTRNLLKGLGGDADYDLDGTIRGAELGRYVAAGAAIANQAASRSNQQPIWTLKGKGDLVVGPLSNLRHIYAKIDALLVGFSQTPDGISLPGVRQDLPQLRVALLQAGGIHKGPGRKRGNEAGGLKCDRGSIKSAYAQRSFHFLPVWGSDDRQKRHSSLVASAR